MTAEGGIVLVGKVVPLIVAAIQRGSVKPVGAEDQEELISEATAIAAKTLDSCESRGKPVSPNSLAYYAIQALKSGRRSGYSGRQDAMCPSVQLDHQVALKSMDEAIGQDLETDDEITLHDMLAGHGESADIIVGRNLDWPLVAERLTQRESYVVQETAAETPGTEIARHLKVCGPRVVQIKREVAKKISEAWGDNAVKDAVRDTRWQRHVRSTVERRICRAERRAA